MYPLVPLLNVLKTKGCVLAATPYQTEEDIGIVENMVVRYLKEPRTIILSVFLSPDSSFSSFNAYIGLLHQLSMKLPIKKSSDWQRRPIPRALAQLVS